MVTARLYLYKGPCPGLFCRCRQRCCNTKLHNIGHRICIAYITFRPQFLFITDHAVDLGHSGKLRGIGLRPQPVTITWPSGASRLALRAAWRAWRMASLVTAQPLIIVVSESQPLRLALYAIAFERIEAAAKFSTRTLINLPRHRIQTPPVHSWSNGQYIINSNHILRIVVFIKGWANGYHACCAQALRRCRCGTSACAASLRQPNTAFPCVQPYEIIALQTREINIGALRKRFVMLELKAILCR